MPLIINAGVAMSPAGQPGDPPRVRMLLLAAAGPRAMVEGRHSAVRQVDRKLQSLHPAGRDFVALSVVAGEAGGDRRGRVGAGDDQQQHAGGGQQDQTAEDDFLSF